MATSLGILPGDVVGAQLPGLPALPAFPGVPGVPTAPTSVPLPSTPDGNVVAPPNVGAPPGTPVAPTPPAMTLPPPPPTPPAMTLPPPPPTFWEEYGGGITAGFAIFGVLALASMVLKGRELAMYVHLRGLGGPPTNKQFYLNSLEASYKKHLASGECPFNALFLAGNDVMTGVEQNPDAMAAMDEFAVMHAQEAMTVPCDESAAPASTPSVRNYKADHTDTYAPSTAFSRPSSTWSPSQDSSDWVFEDISLDDMFGPAQPQLSPLSPRAKSLSLSSGAKFMGPAVTSAPNPMVTAARRVVLGRSSAARAPAPPSKMSDVSARVVPTPTRAPDPPGSNTGMWFVAGTMIAVGIGYLIYRSQSVGGV